MGLKQYIDHKHDNRSVHGWGSTQEGKYWKNKKDTRHILKARGASNTRVAKKRCVDWKGIQIFLLRTWLFWGIKCGLLTSLTNHDLGVGSFSLPV